MSEVTKPDFVPYRINAEPPIFMGLTLGELKLVVLTRFATSLVAVEILVTLIYPHIFTYSAGFFASIFIATTLIKMKAMQIVETQRGKDPFYCQHQSDISMEVWRNRLVTSPRSNKKHSFLVEDRYWSPR